MNDTHASKQPSRMLAIVVPVKGRSTLLVESVSSLLTALSRVSAELVLVDNNDEGMLRDDTLYSFADRARIIKSNAKTIGAVRNEGFSAIDVSCRYIAFVDSDCVVSPDFCEKLLKVFESRPELSMIGCKVVAPSNGHWTERATDELHRESGDGPRAHLNGGCMALRREWFERLGGFSSELPANEDYDLCRRLRELGGSIWQFECLKAIHLGNPKSVAAVFRRLKWHGRGSLNREGRLELSPMAIATLLNSSVVLAALALSLYLMVGHGKLADGLAVVSIGVVILPTAFLVLRMVQYRRWISPLRAIPLMVVTFAARQIGMIDQYLVVRRRRP